MAEIKALHILIENCKLEAVEINENETNLLTPTKTIHTLIRVDPTDDGKNIKKIDAVYSFGLSTSDKIIFQLCDPDFLKVFKCEEDQDTLFDRLHADFVKREQDEIDILLDKSPYPGSTEFQKWINTFVGSSSVTLSTFHWLMHDGECIGFPFGPIEHCFPPCKFSICLLNQNMFKYLTFLVKMIKCISPKCQCKTSCSNKVVKSESDTEDIDDSDITSESESTSSKTSCDECTASGTHDHYKPCCFIGKVWACEIERLWSGWLKCFPCGKKLNINKAIFCSVLGFACHFESKFDVLCHKLRELDCKVHSSHCILTGVINGGHKQFKGHSTSLCGQFHKHLSDLDNAGKSFVQNLDDKRQKHTLSLNNSHETLKQKLSEHFSTLSKGLNDSYEEKLTVLNEIPTQYIECSWEPEATHSKPDPKPHNDHKQCKKQIKNCHDQIHGLKDQINGYKQQIYDQNEKMMSMECEMKKIKEFLKKICYS